MSEELKAMVVDAATGKFYERVLTEEEISFSESVKIQEDYRQAEQEAKVAAKISGMNKLIALGLTEEEAGALING
jgi:hypothetical protein